MKPRYYAGNLLSERTVVSILCFTIMTLFISCFYLMPYADSYYYWNWGRHLALSYYDGPPIIAYSMRAWTTLFGNTMFALNLLGVVSILFTLFFIYKTSELLFNKTIALNACVLWLFSSPVLHYLFFWITYDNPLNLFWAATIYFSIRFIQTHQSKDLYFIGFCSGLLISSKYSGAILLLAILTFAMGAPKYRGVFSNKHFYFSIMLFLFITSPILIWNMKHHWASLLYPFQYHMGLHKYSTSPSDALLRFIFKIIKNLDVLILLPLYAIYRSYQSIKRNHALLLLNYIGLFFIFFLLIMSFQNSISKHWLTPYTISGSILCSYYFANYRFNKLFLLTIVIYITLGIYYIVANCFYQQYFDEDFLSYSLIKEAGQRYLRPELTVITSDWEIASQLAFWLPSQPEIQTLGCGIENQYLFWKKPVHNVLYLDFNDRSSCINQYFSHCTRLPPLRGKPRYLGFDFIPGTLLFAYYCR